MSNFINRAVILILVYFILFCYKTSVRASQSQEMIVLTASCSYTSHTGNKYIVEADPKVIMVLSLLEDIDRNNEVDFTDINLVRSAYGSFPGDSNWNERADIDKNGSIDFADLNMVRAAYGEILE
jgi:hypothetical protein